VCALLAPDFFTVADDGVAVVRRQPADPGEVEVVDDAVADCPAHAIGWVAERAGHA
jgi:ferredoxin